MHLSQNPKLIQLNRNYRLMYVGFIDTGQYQVIIICKEFSLAPKKFQAGKASICIYFKAKLYLTLNDEMTCCRCAEILNSLALYDITFSNG